MNYYPIFGKNYRAFRVVVLLIYAIDKIFTRPPVAAVAPNINSGCAHHIRTEFLMYDSQSLHCLRYMISPLHVVQPELSPKPSSPPFHKSAPSNQSVVCQYKLGSVVELDPIISRIKPPTVLGSHKLF